MHLQRYLLFGFTYISLLYSSTPIYRVPIHCVPWYNVPLCVPPISCFTIEHVLTFPRFTVPPIYRAFCFPSRSTVNQGITVVEILAVIWSCRLLVLYKNPQDQNKGMFFAKSTRLNLEKLMSKLFETHSEWVVDSYHFDPCGYSFNALNGYKILNSCEYLRTSLFC